jgi:methyl-accepting chemotaxis protein
MSEKLTAGVPAQGHAGSARKREANRRSNVWREDLLRHALEHIASLLNDPVAPDMPDDLRDNEQLRVIHDYLFRMRDHLSRYATGDFSAEIRERGVIAGKLKALQANLRHLIWQVQQVEAGDFTQRVHFLGEFADAFNNMVEQLDTAFATMRRKEEELSELNKNLAGVPIFIR